jgi:hypothetical protein
MPRLPTMGMGKTWDGFTPPAADPAQAMIAVSSQRAATNSLRCRRFPYMRDDFLIAASREAVRSGSVSRVAHFGFQG